MNIVCPHCTTSYAINLATLGAAGRNVRCSRCKEVWLARPGDAVEIAPPVPAMAEAGQAAGIAQADAAAEWEAMANREAGHEDTPVVDSPSISAGWPEGDADGAAAGQDGNHDAPGPAQRSRFARLFRRPPMPAIPPISLRVACAAMGGLLLALGIWRADVVRLLPQTATFYKLVGLEVNLRGLAFRDIRISSETVEGKPVLLIEGLIVGASKKPVELPRLRFSVRDAHGAEIYAWNAVLDQPVLNPGESASFRSRLASPPPEGRNIDVRFFNKRDLADARA